VAFWLLLFQSAYPVLELALFPMDAAAFWFYYPKARGCGLVIYSRALRRDGNRGNRAQIFRLDWHRYLLALSFMHTQQKQQKHPLGFGCPLSCLRSV